MKHPSEDIKGAKSQKLESVTLVLGVTGSIAAVETVKLARELIRHGAEVYPVMTEAATKILTPDALEFATGHKPVTSISGKVEHVALAGIGRPMDILLIAPATANTISKLACGIDDTPVTTFATTAIGSGKKVLVVPAMHGSMYSHPIVKENIEKLKKIGVRFLLPKIKEKKAKIPAVENIVSWLIREYNLSQKPERENKKVLLIGGASAEQIDDVRVITNLSTGKSAVSIAKEAFERGYNLTFFYGTTTPTTPPDYLSHTPFLCVEDLKKKLYDLYINKNKFQIIICVAALSDFTPAEGKAKGKICSEIEEISLKLKRTEKILPLLRRWFPDAIVVGYKLETAGEEEKLKKSVKKLMAGEADCHLVVANELKDVKTETTTVLIFKKGKKEPLKFSGKKEELAVKVFEEVEGLKEKKESTPLSPHPKHLI